MTLKEMQETLLTQLYEITQEIVENPNIPVKEKWAKLGETSNRFAFAMEKITDGNR